MSADANPAWRSISDSKAHIKNPARKVHIGSVSLQTSSKRSRVTGLSRKSWTKSFDKHRSQRSSKLLRLLTSCFSPSNRSWISWLNVILFPVFRRSWAARNCGMNPEYDCFLLHSRWHRNYCCRTLGCRHQNLTRMNSLFAVDRV